jgi:hypothetical protein
MKRSVAVAVAVAAGYRSHGRRKKGKEEKLNCVVMLWNTHFCLGFLRCQPAKMSRHCCPRLPQSWEKERGEREKAELCRDVMEYIFWSRIQSVVTSLSFNGAIQDRAASAGGHHEDEAEGACKEAGKNGVRGGGGM